MFSVKLYRFNDWDKGAEECGSVTFDGKDVHFNMSQDMEDFLRQSTIGRMERQYYAENGMAFLEELQYAFHGTCFWAEPPKKENISDLEQKNGNQGLYFIQKPGKQ